MTFTTGSRNLGSTEVLKIPEKETDKAEPHALAETHVYSAFQFKNAIALEEQGFRNMNH